MKTRVDHSLGTDSRLLADLENQTIALERKLSDARASLERERAHFAGHDYAAAGPFQLDFQGLAEDPEDEDPEDADPEDADFDVPRPADPRTSELMSHGRSSAYAPQFRRRRKLAVGAAIVVTLGTIVVGMLSRGGASWPASVTTVQNQAIRACQNPDVRSEPGQVNFACAQSTRQILWVFALLTSEDNQNFTDRKTGRVGLEPIKPTQGGVVAWSLNLHHPYNPHNPIDSLEVAARAINNIIGGATLTGTSGTPVIQPGLESDPANCARYTGSAALSSRADYPSLCARAVQSPAGQAALVADVYQRWIVGAAPSAAQDAAVLFANADNPGDTQVQAVLRRLQRSGPSA